MKIKECLMYEGDVNIVDYNVDWILNVDEFKYVFLKPA